MEIATMEVRITIAITIKAVCLENIFIEFFIISDGEFGMLSSIIVKNEKAIAFFVFIFSFGVREDT